MDFENKVKVCGTIVKSEWRNGSDGHPVKMYRVAVRSGNVPKEITCFADPRRTKKHGNLSLMKDDSFFAEGRICQRNDRNGDRQFWVELDDIMVGLGKDVANVSLEGVVGDVERYRDGSMGVTVLLNDRGSYDSWVICNVPADAPSKVKACFVKGNHVKVDGDLFESRSTSVFGVRNVIESVDVTDCVSFDRSHSMGGGSRIVYRYFDSDGHGRTGSFTVVGDVKEFMDWNLKHGGSITLREAARNFYRQGGDWYDVIDEDGKKHFYLFREDDKSGYEVSETVCGIFKAERENPREVGLPRSLRRDMKLDADMLDRLETTWIMHNEANGAHGVDNVNDFIGLGIHVGDTIGNAIEKITSFKIKGQEFQSQAQKDAVEEKARNDAEFYFTTGAFYGCTLEPAEGLDFDALNPELYERWERDYMSDGLTPFEREDVEREMEERDLVDDDWDDFIARDLAEREGDDGWDR